MEHHARANVRTFRPCEARVADQPGEDAALGLLREVVPRRLIDVLERFGVRDPQHVLLGAHKLTSSIFHLMRTPRPRAARAPRTGRARVSGHGTLHVGLTPNGAFTRTMLPYSACHLKSVSPDSSWNSSGRWPARGMPGRQFGAGKAGGWRAYLARMTSALGQGCQRWTAG